MANSSYPRSPWKLDDLDLMLVTPAEFAELPDGTRLLSISGAIVVKGQDEINGDTRFGYLAFGFPEQHRIGKHYVGKPRG